MVCEFHVCSENYSENSHFIHVGIASHEFQTKINRFAYPFRSKTTHTHIFYRLLSKITAKLKKRDEKVRKNYFFISVLSECSQWERVFHAEDLSLDIFMDIHPKSSIFRLLRYGLSPGIEYFRKNSWSHSGWMTIFFPSNVQRMSVWNTRCLLNAWCLDQLITKPSIQNRTRVESFSFFFKLA